MDAIVTVPPYAPFLEEVARHPIVSGLRLNTVMPVKEPLDELLRRLKDEACGKDVWVDLKCRQLRIKEYGTPPFTEIRLTHRIEVETPVRAYFSDGQEVATVAAVDGDRLLMLDGPRRPVGPGESVNIPHPSLRVHGYFTGTDEAYIGAAKSAGLRKFMLSFVEGQCDVDALTALYPDAEVAAKIESRKGVAYARSYTRPSDAASGKPVRLMAARGDLYVEMGMPHEITEALEEIVHSDRGAIVASRIFPSLADGYRPSCQDIGDVDSLMRMGYRTFMLGDDICQRRESVISGLNLLAHMAGVYERRHT